MEITREEIQAFATKVKLAKNGANNPDWLRMYENLLTALDHFDACLSRSTVEEKVETTELK